MSDQFVIVKRHANEDTGFYEWSIVDPEIVCNSVKELAPFYEQALEKHDDSLNELLIARLDYGWK